MNKKQFKKEELDSEWLFLITEAKRYGLAPEEIREYFSVNKQPEAPKIKKRNRKDE